jgi:hypothetical protein
MILAFPRLWAIMLASLAAAGPLPISVFLAAILLTLADYA